MERLHVQRVTWLGLTACAVGVVTGLGFILSRVPSTCADGTFFPEGTTDFQCYSHPQAGLGVAVLALSVGLGALLWLVGSYVLGTIPSRLSRSAADQG